MERAGSNLGWVCRSPVAMLLCCAAAYARCPSQARALLGAFVCGLALTNQHTIGAPSAWCRSCCDPWSHILLTSLTLRAYDHAAGDVVDYSAVRGACHWVGVVGSVVSTCIVASAFRHADGQVRPARVNVANVCRCAGATCSLSVVTAAGGAAASWLGWFRTRTFHARQPESPLGLGGT